MPPAALDCLADACMRRMLAGALSVCQCSLSGPCKANSRPFRGKGFGLVLRSKLLRPCRISAAAAQHGGGDGDDEAGEEDEYNLQPLFPVPPPAATTQVVYPCMLASRMCCTPGRCRSMGARLPLTTVGDLTLRPSYLSTRQVRLDILIEAGPDGIPCE